MKISIVTATYNSAATVRDTFESVLNQTYPDIEYIVVDGNSKDGTIDLIREYEVKFEGRMHWVSEPDKGIYDAFNKAFKMATGDVVGLVNSDDLLTDSQALEKVMAQFDKHPEIDCVYADLYYVSHSDINIIVRHWITGKQRSFNRGWHPAHPTFYVKRQIYERCGYFDLDYKFAADFELMLRLVEKEHIKMIYLPEPLIKMRLGGATSKNLSNIKKGNLECIRAFHKNHIKVSKLYPVYRLVPKLLQFFYKR